MNIRLIKCALLLALCAVNVKGWAQSETVIFCEESFSAFTDAGYQEEQYNGWKWVYAGYRSSVGGLLLNGSSNTAYLQTPALGLNGSAALSFEYMSAVNSPTSLDFTISISGAEFEDFDGNVSVTKKEYVEKTIIIKNATSPTTIKFLKSGSNGLFLRNIKITTSTYTLSESWNNSYAISAQTGKKVDVTLDRTFTANIWNTLCLPFNLETDKAKSVWGDDVKLRVFSSVEDNTMIFTAPENNTVSAGTPFLLKLSNVSSNPSFSGVTISSTAAQRITKSEGNSDYSFIGTYSPITIAATDLFLKSDGNLYHPSGTNLTLNGLRAYFTLPTVTSARLSISNDDGTATVITPSTIHHPLSSETYYTLDGCRVDAPTANGIYIVHEADGTTHKVFIK